jgi:hypothetical protein
LSRDLILKHLLALRWMNPNALVYLHEAREVGEARVEFELCTWRRWSVETDRALLLSGRGGFVDCSCRGWEKAKFRGWEAL